MKSYQYAELSFNDSGISVSSTDQQVLDALLTELRTVVKNFRMKQKRELPSGGIYDIFIDKLSAENYDVGWWILKQLCQRGWEPFAISSAGEYNSYVTHHFRLEILS